MLEMAEKIINYFQSGHYAALFLAFALSIIYKALPLLNAYHAYRKRRVTDLENTIKSKHISPAFRKNLKEEIECEHFKVVYGVRANKALIDKVFMLHGLINGKRSLNQFANVLKLYPRAIKDADGKYRFKVGVLDYFFGLYHMFFGLLFLIVGLIAFFNQMDIGLFALNGRPLILSIIAMCGGLYMLYMSTPIYSLLSINSALKKSQIELST